MLAIQSRFVSVIDELSSSNIVVIVREGNDGVAAMCKKTSLSGSGHWKSKLVLMWNASQTI